MLFKKRKSQAGKGSDGGGGDAGAGESLPRTVRLEFEMMLKGAVYERPEGKVRQYGVTIDGATRVVSSGDFIDRETYQALVEVGAIRPLAKK